MSYGFSEQSDIRAENAQSSGLSSSFVVRRHGRVPLQLTLNLPGRHNILNSLAAVAVATELGVPDEAIQQAFSKFSGIDRRFQLLGTVTTLNGIATFVDDYAHHPTEIAAVIETVRLRAPVRVWVIFQPHRYSRTISLLERFGSALAMADAVILTEVYAASESPISGATASAVAEAIRRVSATPVRVVTSLSEIPGIVAAEARPGDVVVTLGAGSIGTVPQRIVDALRFRFEGNNE